MKENICPICSGIQSDSATSFAIDYKIGVIIIRDVPAKQCIQCGEEWIEDDVAEKLEIMVGKAKKQKQELIVANFNNYSIAS